MMNPSVDIPLLKSYKDNVQFFSSLYEDSSDVVLRSLTVDKKEALIIYIEGLTDIQKLEEQVLEPLLNNKKGNTNPSHSQVKEYEQLHSNDLLNAIKTNLPITSIKEVSTFSACTEEVANGSSILLVDGLESALALGLLKFEKRSIEEPQAETSIRGSREGFTESITVNTSLVRRIIKDPALKMKSVVIGKHTKTKVVISYIDGLVDKTLIKEIENRLSRINIDGVLEGGYIEQFIEDSPYSPFPQLLYTERPDVVSANLIEGRTVLGVVIECTSCDLQDVAHC